jgi:hypothetical protein
MTIRVALSAAVILAASSSAHAVDVVMRENAIGCPSQAMVNEANAVLRNRGAVIASHWAEMRGCSLFEIGDTVGIVTVDYAPPNSTTCVVGWDNEKCLWIPSGRTKSKR